MNCVIIRKKPEVCIFPKGIFQDGWLTYDRIKGTCWWERQPDWNDADQQWIGNFYVQAIDLNSRVFRTQIVWRGDGDESIQPVGPSNE